MVALQAAPSEVAGWGAFLDEDANQGDLIAEYVGEVRYMKGIFKKHPVLARERV